MKNKTGVVVIRQDWIESEAGWGQRPDGFTLHLNEENCKKYIENYWAAERKINPGGATPDCYTRPEGSPREVIVSRKTFNKIKKAKLGYPCGNNEEV